MSNLTNRWLATGILAAIGFLFLGVTYAVLIENYKNKDSEGYKPSGVPCVGGLILILAFLLSPCKWLAFLGLLDYGLWEVPYLLITEYVIPFLRRK